MHNKAHHSMTYPEESHENHHPASDRPGLGVGTSDSCLRCRRNQKPDFSILSEDFLVELKSYHYKKDALEALKKLFNDELTALAKVKRVATGRKNRQSVGRLIVILLQM